MSERPQRRKTTLRASIRNSTTRSAQLAADWERRERQVSTLYELWRAVPHTETGRLLQMIAERATAAIDSHSCSLMLRERGGDKLHIAASVGLAQDVADSVTLLVGERIAGRVAASGQAVMVHRDPNKHPMFAGETEEIRTRPEVESSMCAPLVGSDGAIVGVLCLSRFTPALIFTESDLRVFSLFAAMAGSVISQSRTVEDLTRSGQEQARMEGEMARTAGLAAMGQFAASVAHELRNPLSAIKGAAQYLIKEFGDGDHPQAAILNDFLSIVVEEVDGLGSMTTDLLEYARPLPPQRQRHDLREVIQSEIGFLRSELTKMGVSDIEEVYAINNPAWVDVDSGQIGRALRNLLLNAAQAMSASAAVGPQNVITVLLQRSGEHGEQYAILVEDTGTGIPEPLLQHLWEPFFTTKIRGTGLGLSQVRQVIVAHGGVVSAENIRTGGARFILRLPAAIPPSPASSVNGALYGMERSVAYGIQ